MQAGDLVRFRPPYYIKQVDGVVGKGGESVWFMGLLIEYHKWEKIATILYDDAMLRIPARDVQKFGRRYLEE